jgi:ADP-ribose pyrophosphatase YjhB (NUDIX family)
MAVDRSYIRVKAMLISPDSTGATHAVSRLPGTVENPAGFDRLVGGSVELGETHRDAIIREVAEELGAVVHDIRFLACVESLFHNDGEPGHEIVFLYTGRLDPVPAAAGATLTEADGSVVPVVWRSVRDEDEQLPLYPEAARAWVRDVVRPAAGRPA